MRFNDRELVAVACSRRPAAEGVLQHLRPAGGGDWYGQPALKERYFKLCANLLLYYRIGDMEQPLGLLVLENAVVARERDAGCMPFAFSLAFRDDNGRKHIFGCRCLDNVDKWVQALAEASYEHWRAQLLILRKKISIRTGIEPGQPARVTELDWKHDPKPDKASFRSHLNLFQDPQPSQSEKPLMEFF